MQTRLRNKRERRHAIKLWRTWKRLREDNSLSIDLVRRMFICAMRSSRPARLAIRRAGRA